MLISNFIITPHYHHWPGGTSTHWRNQPRNQPRNRPRLEKYTLLIYPHLKTKLSSRLETWNKWKFPLDISHAHSRLLHECATFFQKKMVKNVASYVMPLESFRIFSLKHLLCFNVYKVSMFTNVDSEWDLFFFRMFSNNQIL